MRDIVCRVRYGARNCWGITPGLTGKAKSAVGPSRTQRLLSSIRPCFLLAILIVGVTLAGGLTGSARAAEWLVKRVTGTAYFVAPGVPAARAKVGMPLQRGFTLATKSGGRVLLARGKETIMVSPNTTFALSAYRSNTVQTTLLQTSGTLAVDVEKRSRPHFSVETPFFAAVVKGTKFTVALGKKTGRVSVDRGVVAVSDFASGDRTDLTAGQFASTSPESKVGLSVGGKTTPKVSKGTPRAPVFDTPAVDNVPSSTSTTESSASSKASSNASATGQANSASNNAGGNSNGAGNSANSNAGGNSSSSNGNGNSSSNSGSGNSNAGGNSSGNGNSGNSNAGGNSSNSSSNGNGNSSSNGNGNSNSGRGNSNAGGNSNGNGNSGNSNAGGNNN